RLYRYSQLPDYRSFRVSVPVVRDFGRMVKLALALNMAVKLEFGQPEPELMEEVLDQANLFLHQPSVSQPVEFFYSVFMGFYHEYPVSLWAIQQEDSYSNRFVTEEGSEAISKRLIGAVPKGYLSGFGEEFRHGLLSEGAECLNCPFAQICLGYFKWPSTSYHCDGGVKVLFRTLQEAALELKQDLSSFSSSNEKGEP
ncbi:MAG: hypothetical protein ACLGPL_10075, partial [Acidobacteriota bacterium]